MARADGLSGPVRPDGGGHGSGQGAGRGAGSGRPRPGGRPRRAPRRLRLILVGVLLLMLLEIVVLIAVGRAIGPLWTIGLLLLFVVIGGVLVRRESGRTWRALRQAVETGKMPGRELADASLVLVGGLLMVLPGFLSDLVGIFLILPFTRSVSRQLLGAVIGSRMPAGVIRSPGAGGATWPGSGPAGSSQPGGRPNTPRGDDVIEGEIIAEDPPPDR